MTDLENRLRESLDAHAEAVSPTLSGAVIRQSAQPKPFQRQKLYAPLAAVASVLAIAAVPVILLHRHSAPSVPPGRPPGVVTPVTSPSNLPSMSSPHAPAPSPITTSAHPTPAKGSTTPTSTLPAPPSTARGPELPPGLPTSQPSAPSASTPRR
jgi:hypothetical protein